MRIRALPVLLVALSAIALAGCLVESTLDAKGGGTMTVKTRGAPNDTLDAVRARYQGPGVAIVKATMDDKKNITVDLTYTDFRKLGGTRQFESTTFTLTEDAKAKTRTATAVTKVAKPLKLPPDQITYFGKDVTIAITVPGEVVETNGKAKGKTVRWTTPLETLFGDSASTFSVTYKHSGAPLTEAAAGTPAAASATPPAAKK